MIWKVKVSVRVLGGTESLRTIILWRKEIPRVLAGLAVAGHADKIVIIKCNVQCEFKRAHFWAFEFGCEAGFERAICLKVRANKDWKEILVCAEAVHCHCCYCYCHCN